MCLLNKEYINKSIGEKAEGQSANYGGKKQKSKWNERDYEAFFLKKAVEQYFGNIYICQLRTIVISTAQF